MNLTMPDASGDARHTEQIDAHGLKSVRLSAGGSEALVYLQGAHVAAFRTLAHGELLWLSGKAVYAAGKPLRGGVPICFPWFGAHPTRSELPAHGFARTRDFRFEGSQTEAGCAVADFSFESGADTLPLFPYAFRARLRVSVGPALGLAFEVENTGDGAFDYELALHTYLSVQDVRRVEVSGLAGASYDDKVSGARGCVEATEALCFGGETDRVYDSADRVTLLDLANGRRISIDKTGSGTTVVWNPWIDKAKRMTDFGDDEWPHMLCLEAANAGAHAVRLAPGARHTLGMTISAETP